MFNNSIIEKSSPFSFIEQNPTSKTDLRHNTIIHNYKYYTTLCTLKAINNHSKIIIIKHFINSEHISNISHITREYRAHTSM